MLAPELHEPLSQAKLRVATILPLDYEDERKEHSVLFFSTVWSDLLELLIDPVEFMAAQQKDWDPEKTGLKWQLRTPVTAIIRPGDSQKSSKAVMQAFATKALSQLSGNKSFEALLEDPAPHTPAELLKAITETGGFYAEFALCTSVLTIFYWPPDDESDHFSGKLTRGVLAEIPSAGAMKAATLHIDLTHNPEVNVKRTNAELRAEFIFEYLQSSRLADRLKETEIKLTKTQFFEERTQADIPAVAQIKAPNDDTVAKFLRNPDQLPTIQVERLSEPIEDGPGTIESATCCNAMVHRDPVTGQYYYGDLLVKTYFPCS